ncbi:hypothetical protein BV25DRAFT_1824031 [Artomyces pyxidatus]|uniref:Uncharacterized protein n=1 Tax=Artomyces pyxidatus TaxID=48021 RepID=A0ACB8T5U4_9AGAM|nr:hypothetical protein BV25DRAFT_1824031 [Artomyces pyxidatus]
MFRLLTFTALAALNSGAVVAHPANTRTDIPAQRSTEPRELPGPYSNVGSINPGPITGVPGIARGLPGPYNNVGSVNPGPISGLSGRAPPPYMPNTHYPSVPVGPSPEANVPASLMNRFIKDADYSSSSNPPTLSDPAAPAPSPSSPAAKRQLGGLGSLQEGSPVHLQHNNDGTDVPPKDPNGPAGLLSGLNL